MDKKKYDVTALGECLIDFTPYGRGADGTELFAMNPGGAPVNVLVQLSRLNKKTAFIGKVGNDFHGQYLRGVLDSNRIYTGAMVYAEDAHTTLAFVTLDRDGNREFSFSRKPGADTLLRPDEIDPETLNCRIFHCGSLSLTDEPARSATIKAVESAKKNGAIISFDPNYRAPLWRSEDIAAQQIRSILKYVDVLKVSDEEIGLLSDKNTLKTATDELLSCGMSIVAVTLGADGVFIASRGCSFYSRAFKCRAVDTTGAGDSFCGAFLSGLLDSDKGPEELTQDELERIARAANAAASLCIQKKGAIPAIPYAGQIGELLDN